MNKISPFFLKVFICANLFAALFCCAFSSSFGVSAEKEVERGVRLPAIMYHSICERNNNDYVLSPAALEEDLIYLKKHGYRAVSSSEVLSYAAGGSLPEKPILLTFDDGFYNNYYYLPALMEKYDMKCIISVVGAFCDNEKGGKQSLSYSYLTWEQVKALSDDPRIEIQNHSYDMHKLKGRQGVKRKADESVQAYKTALTVDANKNQKKLIEAGVPAPFVFTYPYGLTGAETQTILKELGFKMFLGCAQGINYIKNESSLLNIKRYNRPSKFTSEAFFQRYIDA